MVHEAHTKCLFREEQQIELWKKQTKGKKGTPSTYLTMEIYNLAQTAHPLQQKRPIPFTYCNINQNKFIYMRFSLANNIQVEVISSLLEKTTDSIELQHLLEAEMDMPYSIYFLSWSLEQRSSGNKQNTIKISILVPLHGVKSTSTLLNQLTGFTSIS